MGDSVTRRMMKPFARPRLLVLALYIASAALVTVQQAILRHSFIAIIFRAASFNLFAGRDLYAAHPEQHFDFCKYSPTFAVLFAPLAYVPFALSFLCWTLLNGMLLWYALDRLLPEREATVALALLYLEVLLALQYGQSNALVAALMVLAFVAFEARRPVGAAVSITLGAAVKLFPLAALSVAVFHPRRLRSPPSSSRYSPPPSLDRKSTRLNSSHDQISYAVFCLKKKKSPRESYLAYLRDRRETTSRTDNVHGSGAQLGAMISKHRSIFLRPLSTSLRVIELTAFS